MKILIAYAGKHGATQMCVERLAKDLPRGMEYHTALLSEESPDPSNYDLVIFGSSVYFGKLRKEARSYLEAYGDALLQKPLGLFLVCGLAHEYEYYRDKLLPEALREHAFQTLYFGGSLSTNGLSFMEWVLVKSMRSHLFEEDINNGEYTPTLPAILPESIDCMSTYLRRELEAIADSQKISE